MIEANFWWSADDQLRSKMQVMIISSENTSNLFMEHQPVSFYEKIELYYMVEYQYENLRTYRKKKSNNLFLS